MSWVSISQLETFERKNPPEVSTYTVTFRVISSGGIEPEIFVMSTDLSEFSSVALVPDMTSWPNSREIAVATYKPFYRASQFSRTFTARDIALAFADFTRQRIDTLNRAWSATSDSPFGGEQVFVYDSGTA